MGIWEWERGSEKWGVGRGCGERGNVEFVR